jgi:hypothetical protein
MGSGFVIHCCIGNCCPHSVEIMLESMAGVGCASHQERFWGRGNLELKWVKNWGSVMGFTRDTDGKLESGRSLILAAIVWEASSAQMLSGPAMYSITGRAVLLIRWRRVRPGRSQCATGEEDLEAMRLTHATDEVLLHSVAEWQCLVLIRVSKTRW